MIKRCEVCGNMIRTVYKLPYEDIVGMIHGRYVQHIGICDTCGLIITQNPFSEEALANRYSNFSKFEYDTQNYFLNETSEYANRSNHQIHFIYENVQDIGSVIEVGAASGYNLSLYRARGCECLGIEPSAQNCVSARQLYNVDMFNGVFKDYIDSKKGKVFDLVFLSMTLEHIINPYQFILSCKKINSKYMFIEVPTMDIKFMSEPMGMFCEEHVNYFTFQSLYNLMKAAGYRLVNAEISMGFDKRIPAGWPAMDTLWEKDHMAPSILPAVSSAMLLTSYIEANEVILKKVREKIRSIPHGERLAIWGTGHHVSMLLGNTDLSKKNIVCFYDSDQRKYDWTMVGKEIKSFNSCDIDEHEIDAILIGSYIYQQEIYDQLKNYREMCEIYMLY